MKLVLTRIYHTEGTNGVFTYSGKIICSTIELPWKQNLPGISCIPEGKYQIILRHSQKYGECLGLLHVPNRSGILVHPANYALTELRGCIAPVLQAVAPGKGIFSKKALSKVLDVCRPVLQTNKTIHLIITS